MSETRTPISKAYQPQAVEEKWYRRWLERGCFHAGAATGRRPYSIVIPPPNVTGVLHLGHVLNNTIQDVLARRARMRGQEVLWLPGTDHAGIATQAVVERALGAEGLSRHDLGREAFVERAREWKEKHGGIIIKQLQRLGCSCDWERERYTQDPGYSAWVRKVFVGLYDKGLIYRGRRMVNWCPKTQTALSDEEVIKKKTQGFLYYMRYEIVEEPGEFLEIATTRPETLMGDTGVAVHPDDERYQDLIGKHCRRPFPDAEIPIVADAHIDPEFGTGVLKVTPAHDKADFEIGQRHGLSVIDVLNPDGTLNDRAGEDFSGLDRDTARREAVHKLEEMGLLIRKERYENEIGYSERAGVAVEPRLSLQWFLRYPSVEEATHAVNDGVIRFRPERWKKTYLHWMENIQDWCVSRQLWWGHRIPVWYPKSQLDAIKAGELDGEDLRAAIHVGTEPPPDPENWQQDEDVLDTWFSSWLWPFATMDEPTRATFFPTTDLVTGPDIIFFWVARMIMASYTVTGQPPFGNVFFTSLIRDAKGRKLSKSLGNSPDCLELIDEYGADGVRFGLLRIAPMGTDVRYDEDRMKEGRNFATKLWNAARYRHMQETEADAGNGAEAAALSIYALDILAELRRLEENLQCAYEGYKFNDIANLLYEFFWSRFCDWYLEAIKGDLSPGADPTARQVTLRIIDTVLRRFLIQLHPLMPHITEELWDMLGFASGDQVLMREPLPETSPVSDAGMDDGKFAGEASSRAQEIYAATTRIRNLKAAYNLAASRNVTCVLKPASAWVESELPTLKRLAGLAELTVNADYEPGKGTPATVTGLGELYMPLEGLVDVEEEKKRLSKEIGKVEKEVEKVVKKLTNANFLERAPREVVAENEERRRDWKKKLEQLREMLGNLES